MTSWNLIGTNVYKNDLNAGQASLFYQLRRLVPSPTPM